MVTPRSARGRARPAQIPRCVYPERSEGLGMTSTRHRQASLVLSVGIRLDPWRSVCSINRTRMHADATDWRGWVLLIPIPCAHPAWSPRAARGIVRDPRGFLAALGMTSRCARNDKHAASSSVTGIIHDSGEDHCVAQESKTRRGGCVGPPLEICDRIDCAEACSAAQPFLVMLSATPVILARTDGSAPDRY
ncbi:MAG: hypothetical protein KatS3mg058_2438 [Roseiflexus sp.]|nr:MAG: hypothetical protein KatS3mg058_2438 [Roseiflexus sp.]